MRTTVDINEDILHRAKVRAAKTNRTLTSIIEDGLRHVLNENASVSPKRRITVPVCGSGGLLPGVDLDDTCSLLDRMDGLR